MGRLILDCPESLNAVEGALVGNMFDALSWLGEHRACRSIVLSGAGHSFCTGLDPHRAELILATARRALTQPPLPDEEEDT